MTRISAATLKDDNYIDAISYIATRVMRYKTYDGQMAELDRIYDKLLNYEDIDDNRERIYSAIYIGIEDTFFND